MKHKGSVASEALVIDVTEVYKKLLHEDSTIKLKRFRHLVTTDSTGRHHVTFTTQQADEISAEEREKCRSLPTPNTSFPVYEWLLGQCQIKLHSCATIPSHFKFGV